MATRPTDPTAGTLPYAIARWGRPIQHKWLREAQHTLQGRAHGADAWWNVTASERVSRVTEWMVERPKRHRGGLALLFERSRLGA